MTANGWTPDLGFAGCVHETH